MPLPLFFHSHYKGSRPQALTANGAVHLRDLVLKEFSCSKKIDDQWAFVFDTDSHYDIVFGRDFLLKIVLDTRFSTKTTNWMDHKLPMKSPRFRDDPTQLYQSLIVDNDDNIDKDINCDCFDKMTDAKYEKVNPALLHKHKLTFHLTNKRIWPTY